MVNFRGAWNTFWASISGALGGITTLMAIIGTLMIVIAFVGWLWQKRKGGNMSGGAGGLLITLIIGAILASPGVLIPLVLGIFDFAANALIGFFRGIN